ncbi:hypothetical protein [Carnobacterium sp. FSL E2-0243]|uniref:hypothetical protein n=1 Tax=Carnobacterium sp. FSL E2-0243 TaxID=2921365 RepID=UPI0030F78768
MINEFGNSSDNSDDLEEVNPIATWRDILDMTLEDSGFEIFNTKNFDKKKVPFRGTIADLNERIYLIKTGEKIYMFRNNEFEITIKKLPDDELRIEVTSLKSKSELLTIGKEFEKEYNIVKNSAEQLAMFFGNGI